MANSDQEPTRWLRNVEDAVMWNKRFLKDWCAGALMVMAAAVMNPAMAQKSKGGGGTSTSTFTQISHEVASPFAPAIRQATKGGYALMGGGPDVDEAFRWLIKQAGIVPGSGGRVVVIRTTGDGAYNPYILYSDSSNSTTAVPSDGWVGGASLGLTRVDTLVMPSRAAAKDVKALDIVDSADVLWIAGGDQSTYINFWKDPPEDKSLSTLRTLEKSISALMARGVPIGGTSAGLAVLGGYDYSALYASATSPLSLANPFYSDITLDPMLSTSPPVLDSSDKGFIAPDVFKNYIFDSHFDSRDRGGRLVTFMSRLTDKCTGGKLSSDVTRGIGIGVETALVVSKNAASEWVARRMTNVSTTSNSRVYLLSFPQGIGPTACTYNATKVTPLATAIEVRQFGDGKALSSDEFKLNDLFTLVTPVSGEAKAGTLCFPGWVNRKGQCLFPY